MILNQKQLTIAQKGVADLYEKIKSLQNSDSIEDLLQISAFESRIEDLEADINEFISLTEGFKLEFSEENLPKAVINLRIASGITQKQLADAIEIQEQQIQRYEQNHYQTASFERIIQILRVLSKSINLKIELKKEQIIKRFGHLYVKYPNLDQTTNSIKQRQELMVC